MNKFKQRRGTGLLLMVVAAVSFAAVAQILPVGSVVWADADSTPYSTTLFPEISGSALGVDPSQSLPMSLEVESGAGSGAPSPGIAPSVSMPTAGVLSHSGTYYLSSQFQDQARAGGLTVSAVGSVIRPADGAFVMVIPERYYGPSGSEPFSSEDKKDVLENLADLGIDESAVAFTSNDRYGSTTIVVEVALEALPAQAAQVVEAVQEVVRQLETYGIRYVLSEEHCHQALALARRQAIPSAQQAADDLADAFGTVLGSVTSVLEYPVSNVFSLVRTNADGCGHQSPNLYDAADMTSLDSAPEVTVSVGLQITYSLQ